MTEQHVSPEQSVRSASAAALVSPGAGDAVVGDDVVMRDRDEAENDVPIDIHMDDNDNNERFAAAKPVPAAAAAEHDDVVVDGQAMLIDGGVGAGIGVLDDANAKIGGAAGVVASPKGELLKKKVSRRRSVPDPNSEIGEDEVAFVVRSTGEFFRDYNHYIARVYELRQRKWKCAVTGKSGLSYDESVLSSQTYQKRLDSFPEDLVPALLKEVQYSTERLSAIVNSLHKLFEGKVTKTLLKMKIRGLAQRASYVGAPWIVPEDIAETHGISTQVPKHLTELVDAHKSGQPLKKRKPTMDKERTVAEEAQPEKKKKPEPQQLPLPPPPKPKYPIEDSLLEGFNEVQMPEFDLAPEWAQDGADFKIFGDIYMTWHFLNRFSEELRLSRFDIEVWLDALGCPTATNLVSEATVCLLDLLRQESEHGKGLGPDAIESLDVEHILHVLESVEDEFEESEFKVEGISFMESGLVTSRQFFALDGAMKARVIQVLCDTVLRCETIRSRLDSDLAARHEQKMALRAQQIEDRKEIRDQRKVLKEEKMKISLPSKSKNITTPSTPAAVEAVAADVGEAANAQPKKTSLPKSKLNRKDSITKTKGAKKASLSKKKKKQSPGKKAPLVVEVKKSRQQILMEQKLKRELEDQLRRDEAEKKRAEQRLQSMVNKCNVEEKKRDEDRQRIFAEEMSRISVRISAIGTDRHHSSYYWLPGTGGHIVVVCPAKKQWGWLSRVEQFTALLSVLNEKGIREKPLLRRLSLLETVISAEMKRHQQNLLRALKAVHQPKRRTRSRSRGRKEAASDEIEDDLGYVNKFRSENLV